VPEEAANQVLRLLGLTKRFGARVAVDQVELTVYQGEAFALVGPDGAGKTTIMRLVTGLMDPDAGRVEVLGFNPATQGDRVRSFIGYLPQRFGLYDDLTVLENLTFYADLHLVDRETRTRRLPELLEFSGLAPFQERLVAHLSGGMRQKLGLICVLIHRPRLLILDEPTFGVDPVSRREFWHMLYQLLKSNITIFLSTAYLDEAERAHRVGLLYQGRLLAADTPLNLKRAYVGRLLEVKALDLQGARRVLDKNPCCRQVLVRGDRLLVTMDHDETPQGSLTRALEAQGLEGVSLNPVEPTLEDVFVQMVGGQERGTLDKARP
jgi:ABC-2 type transport system ATP-binding protein